MNDDQNLCPGFFRIAYECAFSLDPFDQIFHRELFQNRTQCLAGDAEFGGKLHLFRQTAPRDVSPSLDPLFQKLVNLFFFCTLNHIQVSIRYPQLSRGKTEKIEFFSENRRLKSGKYPETGRER